MKKVYGIMGGIFTFIGFIMTMAAQITIWDNTRYTWTKPYTKFEAQTLTMKWIGLMFLVWGIIDIVMLIVSKRHEIKNVQDVHSQALTTKTCPECGLIVNNSVKICPKCKKEL